MSYVCVLICKRKRFLSILNDKCHLCALQSTCRPFCNSIHTPHNTIEHNHAKILVGTLECQVSWDDTEGVVVDHYNQVHHSMCFALIVALDHLPHLLQLSSKLPINFKFKDAIFVLAISLLFVCLQSLPSRVI